MTLSLKERHELGSAENRSKSIKTLMAQYKCSAETVKRWRARGQERKPDFSDKPRAGRPRLLKAAERSSIKRSARGRSTVPTITQRVNQHRQEPVSEATVRRVVVGGQHPYVFRPINRGQVLREPNRLKRVVFCKLHAQAHTRRWLFVGSKFLYLYINAAGLLLSAWQDPQNLEITAQGSNPFVFHFYGGVGHDFKSCLISTDPSPPTNGKKRRGPPYTAEAFVEQVLPQLKSEVARFKGSGRVQVILDHASQHDAKISKDALASSGINLLPDFPAQCWDINIIEFVWGKLAEGLHKRRATSARGWKKAVKEEWAKIQQSFINKRVEEVKDRMAEILQRDGAWLNDYKHT